MISGQFTDLIAQIISSDIKTYILRKNIIGFYKMKISNKLVALWSNNEPLFPGKCICGIKTDRTCFYMEIIGDCCIISSRDSWVIPCIKEKDAQIVLLNTETAQCTRGQGRESNEDIEG